MEKPLLSVLNCADLQRFTNKNPSPLNACISANYQSSIINVLFLFIAFEGFYSESVDLDGKNHLGACTQVGLTS